MLLSSFAAELNGTAGLTADEAWQKILTQNREAAGFEGRRLGFADRFRLDPWHHRPGTSGISDPPNYSTVKTPSDGSRRRVRKNERLYRYLGIAAGTLVVLLFY